MIYVLRAVDLTFKETLKIMLKSGAIEKGKELTPEQIDKIKYILRENKRYSLGIPLPKEYVSVLLGRAKDLFEIEVLKQILQSYDVYR